MTHPNSRGKGAANPTSKLTNNQVKMLREYRKGGWPHADLGFFFSISPSRSSEICRGKAYKDAGGPIETGKGRQQYYVTARNPNLKATPDIANAIRRYRAECRLSHAEIADKIYEDFGVLMSKSLVGKILKGVVER
jgi:hypothetical protein